MIKKVKNTVLLTYVIKYLNREGIVGTFYKEELLKKKQKKIKKSLELKN